ncbi:precorrin-6Y C5,15-methyltransferase (decarboxylating) [Sagittula marina]|uniref:Precorrin-6Y C5,15-methyltransferase (Decarboxylating) n=1 Tax=Sagittula marina TaxID=943940 RepID=A0A7W6DUP8_9RHOB|nr:precorrin-6y C5,15-methyltransferase (decarboxylating) subunit CbiE [Sagittula marina]MBB3987252.1 precorrin-6Y C5,15-methyltransferase (decarboxylating) [Sagittula marina]
MSEAPWLTIIGLGEDGPAGLCNASRDALAQAACVMAPARHLSLIPDGAEQIEWPVPFAQGVDLLMARRGQPTVMLASGDPFWFGAGTTVTRHLARDEWQAFPGHSTFSLAAARLGWPLEATVCLGLHAKPLSRLRPHLAPSQRIIVTLRDGDAVVELGTYLEQTGFGASHCVIMEALGGPRERVTELPAADLSDGVASHPVCVAIEVRGEGRPLPRVSGLADDWFAHDGQITKRPIRAMTLSALAPRASEHLWDIGGGCGSIAIEWLLACPSLSATTIEPRADRVALISANATHLGVDRLSVVHGAAPAALENLTPPDAVFVGGGLSPELIHSLETLPAGTRLVINAVTLESEALLVQTCNRLGGELMRMEIANAVPIGPKQGWRASFPITQWSHTL